MARVPIAPLVGGFVEVDGLRLYHRVDVSAGPDAPAVVHLHGFGVSGSYLEPTAVMLSRRARNYVPDLPGTGTSDRADHVLGVRDMADWLLAYCDTMGLDRPVFVGNSLGCVTLIEFAVAHPDRAEALVLVAPAGGPNNQPMPRALGQMALDVPREPPSMIRLAPVDYLRFGIRQGFTLFRAMTRYPTIDRLALLDTPTLMVIGRSDPLVDLSRAQRILGEQHGIAVVQVDGAHALNYSHPVTVAALVQALLDGSSLELVDDEFGAEVVFDNR